MSQVIYVAAIAFSVVEMLLCIGALIGTCFMAVASGYGDYGGWNSGSKEPALCDDFCTLIRWMCCFVVTPSIISLMLMWIIYIGTIDLIIDNEVAFWIVAVIPFCWSLIATIIGFHLACNGNIELREI